MNCRKCGHPAIFHEESGCMYDFGETYCECELDAGDVEHGNIKAELAAWKAEALAARKWIEVLTKLAYSRDTDTYTNGRAAYLAAQVEETK